MNEESATDLENRLCEYLAAEDGAPPDAEKLRQRDPEAADALEEFLAADARLREELRPFAETRTAADWGPPPVEAAPPLPEGYEFVRVLGIGGGLSPVCLAWEMKDGVRARPAAIKVISFAQRTEAFRVRAQREGRAMQSIRHQNVVEVHRVINFPNPDDGLWIVMEYIPGESLESWLPRHALRESIELLSKTARVLAGIHAANIVHRDIKPRNILVHGDTGQPRIIDFGLSRDLDLTALTETGAVLGTLHYMAPEQFESPGKASQAVDIWALGVILYRMLMNHARNALGGLAPISADEGEHSRWDYPFRGAIADVIDGVRKRAASFPGPAARVIPPRLRDACLKCLNKEPKDRYRDGDALADDLAAWLREADGGVEALVPASRGAAPSAPRRGWFAVGAAGLLAAAAFTAVGLYSLPADRPPRPAAGVGDKNDAPEKAIPAEPSTFVGRRRALLDAVAADLETLPERSRKFARYLVLDGAKEDVADGRRGMKLFVEWASEVSHPVQYYLVNPEETLLRINLEGESWLPWIQGLEHWERVVEEYPYRLTWSESAEASWRDQESRARDSMQSRVPIVNADWLLARILTEQGDAANSWLRQWLKQHEARAFTLSQLAAVVDASPEKLRGVLVEAREKPWARDLQPLLDGGSIQRARLESRTYVASPYQKLANALYPVVP